MEDNNEQPKLGQSQSVIITNLASANRPAIIKDSVDEYLKNNIMAPGKIGKNVTKKYTNINSSLLGKKRRQKSGLQQVFDEITKNKNLNENPFMPVSNYEIYKGLTDKSISPTDEAVTYISNLSKLRGYTKSVPVTSSLYKKPIKIVFIDTKFIDNKFTDDCYYWYHNFTKYCASNNIAELSFLNLTDVHIVSNSISFGARDTLDQCYVIDFNTLVSSPFHSFIPEDQKNNMYDPNYGQKSLTVYGREWNIFEATVTKDGQEYKLPYYCDKTVNQETGLKILKNAKVLSRNKSTWEIGFKATPLKDDMYFDCQIKPKNYGTKAVLLPKKCTFTVLYKCEFDFDSLLGGLISGSNFNNLEVGTFDNLNGILSIYQLTSTITNQQNQMNEFNYASEEFKPIADFSIKLFNLFKKVCFGYLNCFIKKVNIDKVRELLTQVKELESLIIEFKQGNMISYITTYIDSLEKISVKCSLIRNFIKFDTLEIPSLIRVVCSHILNPKYNNAEIVEEVKSVAIKIYKLTYISSENKVFQDIKAFPRFLGSLTLSTSLNKMDSENIKIYLEKLRNELISTMAVQSKERQLLVENKSLQNTINKFNDTYKNILKDELKKLNDRNKEIVNKIRDLLNKGRLTKNAASALLSAILSPDNTLKLQNLGIDNAVEFDMSQQQNNNSNDAFKYDLKLDEIKEEKASPINIPNITTRISNYDSDTNNPFSDMNIESNQNQGKNDNNDISNTGY